MRSQPLIPRGDRFEMLERDGDWYKVRYKNQIGYIHKTGVTHPLIHRLPEKREFKDLEVNEKAEVAACIQNGPSSLEPELAGYLQSLQRELRAPERETSARRQSDLGFIWPVGGRISSHFGVRTHPIHGTRTLHKGMDIAGGNMATVVAAKGGTVTVSAGGCTPGRANRRCNGGAGNMVTINHGDGTMTRYFHLNENCSMARRGRIEQGQPVGCIGMTGYATGPHLHFEVLQNGQWLNPHNCLPRR